MLVGISGVPASGKSTFAKDIVEHCNDILGLNNPDDHSGKKVEAILVGLDGWHLSRAQLDAFPDPKIAHDRRGAHWTFDGTAYAEFISELRVPIHRTPEGLASHLIIKAPSFDHALKDPSPGAVSILPHHRIVVIEGLYTFLSIDPWRTAGDSLDERWFIDVDFEIAKRRLVKRHVVTGVAKDMDEAIWRADNNDIPSKWSSSLLSHYRLFHGT